MDVVVATLALIVATQYAVIALLVVPLLARLAITQSLSIHLARWGAVAFFAGCAVTHVMIAITSLRSGGDGSDGAGMSSMSGMGGMTDGTSTTQAIWQHVVPHVAQVVGGALFIGVARHRLALSVMTKTEASALRELELQMSTTFERAPVGVALFAVDRDSGRLGAVLQVNPALCRLVGYGESELRSRPFEELLVHGEDRERTAELMTRLSESAPSTLELEQRWLHREGQEIWVQLVASLTHDEMHRPLHCLLQVRDVTDDRRREAQLKHLAEHDSLTGVFNRHRFGEELERLVAGVRRQQKPAALLIVDLDHFKYVNDTYGHATGDRLLCVVAGVLSSRLRSTDVLGRLGGDEFGVLLPDTDEEGAGVVAQALLTALRQEAHVDVLERSVRSAASIGITMIQPDDEIPDADRLLAEADIAMYEAKESGRDRVASAGGSALRTARMRARLTWSERVRDALDEDGFTLYEQPILNLVTGALDRSELLVRMVDASDGSIILPGDFLPVAERFGQIQRIDSWVFARAIELLELRARNGDSRSLEINLSGASLTDETLIDEISHRLHSASFDHSRLIVEVTETAAVGTFDLARTLAARLAAAGCRFALDDFGSGFGSFYYLKHLHFDGVKIDGEFVKDLPASRYDLLTLDAMVSIARGLGKEVTAEFVQNDETLDLLRDRHVGFAQGFHIARPHPVPEFAGRSLVAPS